MRDMDGKSEICLTPCIAHHGQRMMTSVRPVLLSLCSHVHKLKGMLLRNHLLLAGLRAMSVKRKRDEDK